MALRHDDVFVEINQAWRPMSPNLINHTSADSRSIFEFVTVCGTVHKEWPVEASIMFSQPYGRGQVVDKVDYENCFFFDTTFVVCHIMSRILINIAKT